MRTPYSDDGTWEFDPISGGYVQTGVPAMIFTDANGNTVLVNGSQEILILDKHIVSCSGNATSSNAYVPTILDISAAPFDTHGLADLANNRIENPYYGIADCYVRGLINVSFASGTGTYRSLAFSAGGADLMTTLTTVNTGNLNSALLLIPIGLLSSALQYVGFKASQDIGSPSNIALTGAEIEFFR